MDIYTITTHQTLDTIARNCPRALSTYIHIVTRSDNSGKAVLCKEKITADLSESFTKFRNDLRELSRQNLLEWHQIDLLLHVQLALPEDFHQTN